MRGFENEEDFDEYVSASIPSCSITVDFSKEPIEVGSDPSGVLNHKTQNLIQMIYETVRNYKQKFDWEALSKAYFTFHHSSQRIIQNLLIAPYILRHALTTIYYMQQKHIHCWIGNFGSA